MTSGRPAGSGRVGIVENWELRRHTTRDANSGAFKGLLFVGVALVLITVGGWYAARPFLGPFLTDTFESNPGIVNVPVISDIIAAEFADRLDQPAGESDREVAFVIEPGETVDDIQTNLEDQGLLTDPSAFKYAVVRDRVDQLIKAGVYTMSPRITPAGIAARLEGDPDPPTPVITLDMRYGRRIEQHVAYLQQESEDDGLELDASEFLQIARNPSKELREQYPFLQQAPEGASLEGFLYGGTYEVPIDISAEELIHQMLGKFDENAARFVAQSRKQGYDFYDVLRIASLVEREAKADSDRKKIAGVYWNRLDPKVNKQTNGLLQADPTVVYATDSMALADTPVKDWDEYLFWDLLGVADYATVQVDKKYESFQTYLNPGLPDWPIVTPSAKSLQAALDPTTKSKLLFFYACEGSDTHTFAKNLAQHQRNIQNCQ
jgi:peptidoglycan lytic transglycosylase G